MALKHSESEDSFKVVEQVFKFSTLHLGAGPPGESNTWAHLKCLTCTFLVNSTCECMYVPGLSPPLTIVEQEFMPALYVNFDDLYMMPHVYNCSMRCT